MFAHINTELLIYIKMYLTYINRERANTVRHFNLAFVLSTKFC